MAALSPYSTIIHRRTYAKYIPDQGRCESWPETVARFTGWLWPNTDPRGAVSETDRTLIHRAILNRQIFPAMRLMWAAGPAADREHVTCYNCSFLTIDCLEAFREVLYILMCGCGVGFSVQKCHVDQLPRVPCELTTGQTVLVVQDSREGWAQTLYDFLKQAFEHGNLPDIDYSLVRPAGAALKTTGGRASGPGALKTLMAFVRELLWRARGRQLRPVECHELVCNVAEIVRVGGVRRAALISLSDLHDVEMRDVKSGAWWEIKPYLGRSNNSAIYTDTPSAEVFLQEFCSLIQSKSGERGFFNEQAARARMKTNGRREVPDGRPVGTNPCCEVLLWAGQFCNLTEAVARPEDSEAELAEKIRLATILGTLQSTLTNFNPRMLRPIWRENCEKERLLGVSITGIFDCPLLHWIDNPITTPNDLRARLIRLRQRAIETNMDTAAKLGIATSAAITCVKPSGTVSQLAECASGIHPTYDRYYLRTIRVDKPNAVYRLLKEVWPAELIEDEIGNETTSAVVGFPMRAPEEAVIRDGVSAVDHFQLWLDYANYWCEHKPSTTINVKDHEWPVLAGKIYENFHQMSGVALLPHDGGIYQQAPYQVLSRENYERLIGMCPKTLDWDLLSKYDRESNWIAQNAAPPVLACTAGGCEY